MFSLVGWDIYLNCSIFIIIAIHNLFIFSFNEDIKNTTTINSNFDLTNSKWKYKDYLFS